MRLFRVAVLLAVAVPLMSGCGRQPTFVAKDEPWRADEERACLSSGIASRRPFVTARSALGGPSVCGAIQPFEMSAAASGRVHMQPAAMLRCPMVPAVDHWVQSVVEPAARRFLGVPIAELKIAASYSCRPINGIAGGRLSEHGHANALDVSVFHLADGRSISVKDGWYGTQAERAFLRAVHGGACNVFSTVLGPEADAYHRDHFHFDLARHGRNGEVRICR